MRPTHSLSLYLQMVGRSMRPDGNIVHILDHVALVYEHGLPDIEHEWKLDGASPARAGKDKDAPLRRCPSCGCIHVMSKTCPNCAYEYPVVDRSVMIADGTLILIKETAFAGRREPVSRPTGPVPEGMMTIEQYAEHAGISAHSVRNPLRQGMPGGRIHVP